MTDAERHNVEAGYKQHPKDYIKSEPGFFPYLQYPGKGHITDKPAKNKAGGIIDHYGMKGIDIPFGKVPEQYTNQDCCQHTTQEYHQVSL